MNVDLICATGPCRAPSKPLNRMLPRVKPAPTAAPLLCVWKPRTALAPAVLLLLNSWKAWLKVADPAKVALAFTCKLLALLLPTVASPKAFKALPLATMTVALASRGAEKAEVACTVRA